jgi:proteasome lid subunit RPN8/RPN11
MTLVTELRHYMKQLILGQGDIIAILTALHLGRNHRGRRNCRLGKVGESNTKDRKTDEKNEKAIPSARKFLITTLFLRECLAKVTPGPDEALVYLTGHNVGEITVIDQFMPLELVEQSRTYVRACNISVARELESMRKRGFQLLGTVHSHPGWGSGATFPSNTDKNHHDRLELMKHTALGLIITRDGHLRFYSGQMRFKVEVIGKDVVEIGANSYKLLMDFNPMEDDAIPEAAVTNKEIESDNPNERSE